MRSRTISRISSVGLVQTMLPQVDFVYPKHIDRSSLDVLPNSPGVYIFRDAQQRPLYVGKSVNLRNRVLSHLRNPDEARMLQLTQDIQHQCTAGEIGALLLEAKLIKQLQPSFNVLLRQQRSLCSLHITPPENSSATPATPQFVLANQYDFARSNHLYGLFSGKHAALTQYRQLIDEHQLCPAKSGLEKLVHGRACFAHQVGRCRGACVGLESLTEHHLRLFAALHDLKLMVWPFEDAIGIVEQHEQWRQMHIVHLWCYLGSINLSAAGPTSTWNYSLPQGLPQFDADTYKILLKPLLSGNLQLETPPMHGISTLSIKQASRGRKPRTTPVPASKE